MSESVGAAQPLGSGSVGTSVTADLASIEAEWLDLWERDPNATIFTHPAWYGSYVAAVPDTEPLVVVQRGPDGKLLAVWPLERRSSALVFLSEPRADYARPTVAPGTDLDSLVRAMLAAVRKAAPGLRILLREFRSDDVLPEILMTAAAEHGYHPRIAEGDLCVRLSLADEPDGFQKRFVESKERKKVLKRLSKAGEHHWERLIDRAEMLAMLPHLFALHTRRWSVQGSAYLAEPWNRRFYCELVKRLPEGSVYFAQLVLNGRPIAVDFHFAYRGTLGHSTPVYNAAYAELSPGFAMLSGIGVDLARGGFGMLDFLRGGESYKLRFANSSGYNRHVLLFPSVVDRWRYLALDRARVLAERGVQSHPSLRRRARMLRAAISQYGVSGAIRRASGEASGAVRRLVRPPRLLLFAAGATSPAPATPEPRLTWRSGTVADVFLVVDIINPIGKADRINMMFDRLERGDELVLGFWDSQLAYSGWYSRASLVSLPEVEQEMRLPPGSIYIYDCRTDERFQGRGIYSRALAEAVVKLGRGELAFITCLEENTASRRGILRAGFTLREVLRIPRSDRTRG